MDSFYTQSTSCASVSSWTGRNKIPHEGGSGGCGQQIRQIRDEQQSWPTASSFSIQVPCLQEPEANRRCAFGTVAFPKPHISASPLQNASVWSSLGMCYVSISPLKTLVPLSGEAENQPLRRTAGPRRPSKVFLLAGKGSAGTGAPSK